MKKKADKLYYGWIITAVLWMIYFLIVAPSGFSLSVITTRMVQDMGWGEEIVGLVSSSFHITLTLLAIPAGVMIGKIGSRKTMIFGAAVTCLGYILIYIFSSSAMIFVALCTLMGFATNFTAMIPAPDIINRWFKKNRSLPMAIVMAAGGIGGFIVPNLTNMLAERFGWRMCWLVFAGMTGATIILTLLFIKEKPEDIGEVPDGRAWAGKSHKGNEKKENSYSRQLTAKEACRTKEFYVLMFLAFSSRVFLAAVSSYLIIYAMGKGLTSASAALCYSMFNIASFVGRLATGSLERLKMPIHITNVCCFLCLTLGGIGIGFSSGFTSLVLMLLISGFAYGFELTLLPLLTTHYFGDKDFSTIYGFMNTAAGAAGIVAPMIVFAIQVAAGGYQYSFLFVGVLSLVCAIAAVTIPGEKRKSIKEQKSDLKEVSE